MKNRGVTLPEIIVVLIICAILSSLALTNLNKTKERNLGLEAKAALREIWEAERRYRVEHGICYPCTAGGMVANTSQINAELGLALSTTNWYYSIEGSNQSCGNYNGWFNATAFRNGTGGYLDCEYSVYQICAVADHEEPEGNANCP